MKKFIYILLLIVAIAAGSLIYLYQSGTFNKKSTSGQNQAKNDQVETKNEETKKDEDKIQDFVLYNGMEISRMPGVQDISEMEINEENNKKYNIKYYNYENNEYLGETEGEFGEEVYEGFSVVTNVKTIATSEFYDAVPRKSTLIEKMPEELKNKGQAPDADIEEIDLDGDGKNEYILLYKVDIEGNENGAEPQAFSGVMLFDNNYEKLADLVTLKNGFWGNIKEEDKKVFLSFDDIEYIDIDCDGIMEIVIKIPTYEETKISIVKYSNGEIQGETGIQASVES